MTEMKTTLLQLQEVFLNTRCNVTVPFRIVDYIQFNVDCDEVHPNLFVGNVKAAENKRYLKAAGISHVVNMAEDDVINTGASFYEDQNIKYLGVAIMDTATTNIEQHFQTVAKFIESGICGGGKVLVHCLMGYSRSVTCAIAYLMICEGMSAVKACKTVKSKRVCRPNDGFLQQLVDLDNQSKCSLNLES